MKERGSSPQYEPRRGATEMKERGGLPRESTAAANRPSSASAPDAEEGARVPTERQPPRQRQPAKALQAESARMPRGRVAAARSKAAPE
eukprot:5596322-Alexandrium_andersonii.AAC.1